MSAKREQGRLMGPLTRGWAFVRPDHGGPDIFAYHRNFLAATSEMQNARNGTRVEFEIREGRKPGYFAAYEITFPPSKGTTP